MKTDKVTFSGIVLVGYAAFLLTLMVMPHYKYGVTYKAIMALGLPLWGWIALQYSAILRKNLDILLSLLAIALISIVSDSMRSFNEALNWTFLTYLCIYSFFLLEMMMVRKNKYEIGALLIILMAMFGYVFLQTYLELERTPGVARLLAYGTYENETINQFRSMNIGGFGFAYAIGLLTPYLAILAMRHAGMRRMVMLALWFFLFLFCFKTQYTTLIFLTTSFSIFTFTSKMKSKLWRFALILSIIILCLVLPALLIFFAEHTEYTMVARHFYDIAGFLEGNNLVSSRDEIYWEMFKLFLQNPILGADLSDANNLYWVNHSHSTFFCLLAGYGILVTFLWYFILCRIYKKIASHLRHPKDLHVIFVMLFVLSVLNPITVFEIFVMTMLFVPLMEWFEQFSPSNTGAKVPHAPPQMLLPKEMPNGN